MTPWVIRIMIANVIVFALQMIRPALTDQLAFVPALVVVRPWTLITYMFAHGGFSHILFNMLGLFFFGPRLELELGSRRFLQLYTISGLMGAVLSAFTPTVAIIGASGAVYGVMMGFAMLWPREQIYVWGVLPVQVRTMVVVITALSLFGGFGGGGDIAHFAHLGGFLGSYLYMKWWLRGRYAVVQQARAPSASAGDLRRWKSIPRERLHEVNREELDRIMHKLDAQGAEGLTQEERDFLDRFSGE